MVKWCSHFAPIPLIMGFHPQEHHTKRISIHTDLQAYFHGS